MKTKILSRLSKALHDEYKKLTEDEIIALDKECKSVSSTNCGWSEFAIADLFMHSVSAHVNNRKQAEQRKGRL